MFTVLYTFIQKLLVDFTQQMNIQSFHNLCTSQLLMLQEIQHEKVQGHKHKASSSGVYIYSNNQQTSCGLQFHNEPVYSG